MGTGTRESMSVVDENFQDKYGGIYKKILDEAGEYVNDPAKLRSEIELERSKEDVSKLRAPYPDQYAYRMNRYRGFLRYPERLKNFLAADNDERSILRNCQPAIIDIEPNSRCNSRCIMCQVSEWENGKRADDMTFREFREFMETQKNLIEVKLHGMGDPFINKEFIEMTEYLTEQDIWVRTSTNASLLHVNDNARRVIDAGIGEIQISFDGATREVFEKIRRGSNFERIVKNCTLINDYANRKDRLYTRMWVLVQEYNSHQILEFVEIARKMQFQRISFSLSLNDWGQEEWNSKNHDLEARNRLTEEDKFQLAKIAAKEGIDITVWEQANKYSLDNPKNICSWPFTRPYITSDSRIVPCCMIANPEVADFGDAREFNQLWNAPVYQEFRKKHLDGNIPKYCRNCYR